MTFVFISSNDVADYVGISFSPKEKMEFQNWGERNRRSLDCENSGKFTETCSVLNSIGPFNSVTVGECALRYWKARTLLAVGGAAACSFPMQQIHLQALKGMLSQLSMASSSLASVVVATASNVEKNTEEKVPEITMNGQKMRQISVQKFFMKVCYVINLVSIE